MKKTITVENMSIEEARENLGGWLIGSAVLSKHRGVYDKLNRLDDLTTRAWQLLGPDEYTKIFNRVVKATTEQAYLR